MRTRSGRPLLWILLLVGSFAWGLATGHYRTFPYQLIEALAGRLVGADGVEPGETGSEAAGDRRPGLWHLARRSDGAGSMSDRKALEELADLPYMSGYELAPESDSVTVFDAAAAWDGLNLVVSGHAPEAYLMDMRGKILHRWRGELADVWPEMARAQELGGFETFFRRAHVLPNGDLLAIYDGIGMIKLDRDSNPIWTHAGREHHDLFVDERGFIHTLTRRTRSRHERFEMSGTIEEDFITVLSPEGDVERELSVLESFLDSDYASILALARRQGDILHTNTIELMDGRFADRHPMFRAGNILISIPRLNTIAVIDPRAERVVWALAGMWQFQHQPTVLDNGNILLFDNTGNQGESKVVEIDPRTQEIAWAYSGSPERRFTSYFLGSSQRLPNGNTLITESTAGRAFEVTTQGEIVWEYVNPHRAGEDDELIASLLEVVRLESTDLSEEFRSLLAREAKEVSRTPPRVLLIGLDGADLRNVQPLSAAGRLPHLTRLMAEGVTGMLETVANASPIVWTSVATGVVPEKHGIEFFRLEGEPAASTMRQRPAFWNVLTHYERSVGVLAWWATFPAERVRGYLISPYVLLMPPRGTQPRVERFWDPGDPRKTYPPDLQGRLADLIHLDGDLDLSSMKHLYADPERTTNTGWALAKDLSYYQMARRLLVERPVETVAIYFQGIDAASHDFDRHVHGANVNRIREPRVSRSEVRAAMGRVESMYAYIDELVGGLVEHAGTETDVIVVSDHGWSYDGTSHWNNDPGVFIAAGPSFRATGRFEGLSVLDVMPIMLTILGAPLSRDFDGSVPAGLLRQDLVSRIQWLDAYPFPAVALDDGIPSAAPEDELMLERLRSLGYLSEN